jgi:hypothetical protein
MAIDALILTGRYPEAVGRLGVKDPSRVLCPLEATGVRDSVVAHMCLGQFAEASSMADAMVTKFPHEVSWDYMYAGMVRWFQRQRKLAASIWREGLTCGYTFYHGLDCALLLWYASVRTPSLGNEVATKRMGTKYFKQLRDGYFIDAIVRYISDEIDEAEARQRAFEESWEHFVAANLAQLEFYVAAKAYSCGNRRAFRTHMAKCATAEGLDSVFPELLIARFETGMLPFQFPDGEYNPAGHPAKRVRRRRRVQK